MQFMSTHTPETDVTYETFHTTHGLTKTIGLSDPDAHIAAVDDAYATLISLYEDQVRANGAEEAVATDNTGEVLWEVLEVLEENPSLQRFIDPERWLSHSQRLSREVAALKHRLSTTSIEV
jgi:hypothetical protein